MKKISECEQIMDIAIDSSIRETLLSKVIEEQKIVFE
jgi:hypothetical protein